MILGHICTRACTFCAVRHGVPEPPDPKEPRRIAEAVRRLKLRHVVVTSVTRDDLPDGGSAQFAATVRAVHRDTTATIEVLTPDFGGRPEDLDRVLDARPEVFNHNVETVPRLYGEVRPQADYARSLGLLARAGEGSPRPVAKSGLMLGLGETEQEVRDVLGDLRRAGCCVVTLGQYLAPSAAHHPVAEFVRPERFKELGALALKMGFHAVASGPFVRSSYGAETIAARVLPLRTCASGTDAGAAGCEGHGDG
jgi:lipoic acid synthetase